jgi:prephenate dehydratase
MSRPQSPTSPTEEGVYVAYLGPVASYTHQAALDSFTEPRFTLRPETSIEDVFAAVANGSASRGVVPFENSSNGSVVFTLDLFANLSGNYGDIVVVNEAYVRVNHCIVGHPAATTNTEGEASQPPDWSHITKLYSHPQAWGQCKTFLGANFKHAEKQDVSSTSRGAALVAANPNDTKTAAISSALAAKENGLAVLAPNIQDSSENTTRFLIIRRASETAPLDTRAVVEAVEWDMYKTLVSFTVSQHGAPGALADCLAVFKKHKITLTSINSRPSGEGSWHYVFFVEFRGRKRTPDQGGPVNVALEDLGAVAKDWRWLGSFEDAAKYAE